MEPTDIEVRREIATTLVRILNRVRTNTRSERNFGDGVLLTGVEAQIIALIYSGRTVAVEIANDLGVSQSAVSQVLTRLKSKDLVTVGRDETNAKLRPLALTDTGKAAAQAVVAYYQRLGEAVFGASGAELRQYAKFVTNLEAFLQADPDE